MKIRKDFVTNSSSSNFVLQTIFGTIPAAGVALGSLSSNLAQLASESDEAEIDVTVSGSSDDTRIIDGQEAIDWLADNGYWNPDNENFTDSFWDWYDDILEEDHNSLHGICGDFNSDNRDKTEFSNIVLIVDDLPGQDILEVTLADDTIEDHDDLSDINDIDEGQSDDQGSEGLDLQDTDDTSLDEQALEEQDLEPEHADDLHEGDESAEDESPSEKAPSQDNLDDNLSQPEHVDDTINQEEPHQANDPSFVDKMNDKLDDFLSEADKDILRDQNVTVHLEINGDPPQTIEIDVEDGHPVIREGKSKEANITVSFNESLLENIKKLGPSKDKGKRPSASDILDIQVKTDNKHNDLAMRIIDNKINEFIKDKKLGSGTGKAIKATLRMHFISETFGRLTSLAASFLE